MARGNEPRPLCGPSEDALEWWQVERPEIFRRRWRTASRAFELVTPAQKNAAQIGHTSLGGLPTVIAGDGSRMIASSIQCFDESQSCTADRASKGPPYEFNRTESGWLATPLAPPADTYGASTVWGYDADSGLVLDSAPLFPSPRQPDRFDDEFYARQPDGAFEGVGPLTEAEPFKVVGGTVDLATVSSASATRTSAPRVARRRMKRCRPMAGSCISPPKRARRVGRGETRESRCR